MPEFLAPIVSSLVTSELKSLLACVSRCSALITIREVPEGSVAVAAPASGRNPTMAWYLYRFLSSPGLSHATRRRWPCRAARRRPPGRAWLPHWPRSIPHQASPSHRLRHVQRSAQPADAAPRGAPPVATPYRETILSAAGT